MFGSSEKRFNLPRLAHPFLSNPILKLKWKHTFLLILHRVVNNLLYFYLFHIDPTSSQHLFLKKLLCYEHLMKLTFLKQTKNICLFNSNQSVLKQNGRHIGDQGCVLVSLRRLKQLNTIHSPMFGQC